MNVFPASWQNAVSEHMAAGRRAKVEAEERQISPISARFQAELERNNPSGLAGQQQELTALTHRTLHAHSQHNPQGTSEALAIVIETLRGLLADLDITETNRLERVAQAEREAKTAQTKLQAELAAQAKLDEAADAKAYLAELQADPVRMARALRGLT